MKPLQVREMKHRLEGLVLHVVEEARRPEALARAEPQKVLKEPALCGLTSWKESFSDLLKQGEKRKEGIKGLDFWKEPLKEQVRTHWLEETTEQTEETTQPPVWGELLSKRRKDLTCESLTSLGPPCCLVSLSLCFNVLCSFFSFLNEVSLKFTKLSTIVFKDPTDKSLVVGGGLKCKRHLGTHHFCP